MHRITIEEVEHAGELNEDSGFCLSCGCKVTSLNPSSRFAECPACGEH